MVTDNKRYTQNTNQNFQKIDENSKNQKQA